MCSFPQMEHRTVLCLKSWKYDTRLSKENAKKVKHRTKENKKNKKKKKNGNSTRKLYMYVT